MSESERKELLRDRLKEAMRNRGLKAVELCERTGIPKSAISYYLAGKSQPKADRLYKISAALQVSEAWLLGFDVPMERTIEQKKSDDLVAITSRLRRDADFYGLVSNLDKLPEEQLATIKSLVAALVH